MSRSVMETPVEAGVLSGAAEVETSAGSGYSAARGCRNSKTPVP